MLLLGIGDPAQGAAEVDPGPLGRGGSVGAGLQPRVGERHPAGRQAELAEPVELASGLRLHVVERLEVVDLGGDLGAERAWVEAVDPLDRRAARPEPGPERGQADARRR